MNHKLHTYSSHSPSHSHSRKTSSSLHSIKLHPNSILQTNNFQISAWQTDQSFQLNTRKTTTTAQYLRQSKKIQTKQKLYQEQFISKWRQQNSKELYKDIIQQKPVLKGTIFQNRQLNKSCKLQKWEQKQQYIRNLKKCSEPKKPITFSEFLKCMNQERKIQKIWLKVRNKNIRVFDKKIHPIF